MYEAQRIHPGSFKFGEAYEMVADIAHDSRVLKASVARLEKFASIANQLIRSCGCIASDDTVTCLASDLTVLLAEVETAHITLRHNAVKVMPILLE